MNTNITDTIEQFMKSYIDLHWGTHPKPNSLSTFHIKNLMYEFYVLGMKKPEPTLKLRPPTTALTPSFNKNDKLALYSPVNGEWHNVCPLDQHEFVYIHNGEEIKDMIDKAWEAGHEKADLESRANHSGARNNSAQIDYNNCADKETYINSLFNK